MEPIIHTENLTFSYPAEEGKEAPPVLRGVSLDIPAGQFLAVLGHNGSGKSTFAKHLNSILLPMGGKAYVDGIDTCDEERVYDIRQRIGMVFQNPDNQIVATVVEEDVAFGLENLGLPPAEIRRRVDESLKAVDMFSYREHAPHRLSGGQKQRVAIAGVIAMRPKVLVLDEPTAMLDPRGRKEVMATLQSLKKEYGITIVLITHYMDEAAQADRVVVMDDGRVLLDGTPYEVFQQVETLKSVGLDVPQATELLHLLQKGGCRLPGHVLTAQECADTLLAYWRSLA